MNKVCLFLFLICTAIRSQSAFETLSFNAQMYAPSFSTEFSDYFSAKKSIGLEVVTPYYYGEFYVGAIFYSFNDTQKSTTSFDVNYLYLGWQKAFSLSQKIRGMAGLHIGSYEMDFDNEDRWYYKSESEFVASIKFGFVYSLTSIWEIGVLHYSDFVFTHNRIKMHNLSAVLSYKIETPEWLKTFLR